MLPRAIMRYCHSKSNHESRYSRIENQKRVKIMSERAEVDWHWEDCHCYEAQEFEADQLSHVKWENQADWLRKGSNWKNNVCIRSRQKLFIRFKFLKPLIILSYVQGHRSPQKQLPHAKLHHYTSYNAKYPSNLRVRILQFPHFFLNFNNFKILIIFSTIIHQ